MIQAIYGKHWSEEIERATIVISIKFPHYFFNSPFHESSCKIIIPACHEKYQIICYQKKVKDLELCRQRITSKPTGKVTKKHIYAC
jgi:hypothetical protein